MVPLVQHCIDVCASGSGKRPAESGQAPEVPEKKAKNPSSMYEELVGKIGDLERQLKDKKSEDEKLEFQRLKRETKEAALSEVKPDELFAKLILLDNMARTVEDPKREQISMLISRYQAHRDQPKFAAALVVKMLSSKEEEVVLDKEQKMLKAFGLDMRQDAPKQSSVGMGGQSSLGINTMPNWQGFPFPPSPFFFQQRGAFGNQRHARPRARTPTKLTCFKWHMPGHMVKDCPQNQDNRY